jgi:pimeloyl-ACP methyl ester carboxylesterase
VLLALVAFRYAASEREAHGARAAAPVGGRYVKADDVEIFIQEAGPASGPAVLFVHGTGAWSEAWRASLEAAGRAGFHAIALDLPPFGYSTRPPTSYAKDVQGKRIVAVLDSLGVRRAILVGHSFGAGPTTEAAFAAPGRVRALVLVDGALSIEPDTGGLALGAERVRPAAIAAVLGFPMLRDALVATFLTNPLFTRKLLTAFVDNPASATDAWVEIYRRPHHVRGTTAAIGTWLPELVAPGRVTASEVAASYSRLDMPLTAIWGERDTITPISQGERLVKLVKGAKLVRLEGVGHIPQIEDTPRFNRALVEVLSQVPAEP